LGVTSVILRIPHEDRSSHRHKAWPDNGKCRLARTAVFCYHRTRCGSSLRGSGIPACTSHPCLFLNEVQRTDQPWH